MPILDVTVVGGPVPPDAPQRLADACGQALERPPGRTWVRLHEHDGSRYAEHGGGEARPVFVSILASGVPDDPAPALAAVTSAVAQTLARPASEVHAHFEPAAAGRLAFGGERLAPTPAKRAQSGAPWESIVGYSRAVRIDSHIWVTGTTSFDAQGAPVAKGDAYGQAKQTLSNIEQALQTLGAGLQSVVRTRMFVVDIDRDWQAVGRAHQEAFGEVRPATTMVEVRRLIAPWMRVEIEADAYVR